jgi:nitronate monooxygenase
MSSETAFTHRVGCQLSPQQADTAGIGGSELATAVADAGALDMLATRLETALATLVPLLTTATRQTSGMPGISFLMPCLDRDAVIAASIDRVVELFYAGRDASLVAQIHEGAALAGWQVGSPDGAKAAFDAGCDIAVAQSFEAGDHGPWQIRLLPLHEAVLGVVKLPVVAAGGTDRELFGDHRA